MAVNKVIYNKKNGAQTLIDLTDSTVTPETLADGVIAYNSRGERIVGTMKSAKPDIINLIPSSTDANGQPYNGGLGYKNNTRLSSSTGAESTVAGHTCTGFMPVTSNDKIYITGIGYTDEDKPRIGVYDSSKANLKCSSFAASGYAWATESNGVWCIDVKTLKSSGVAFFRFSAIGFTGDTIITVNQPLS